MLCSYTCEHIYTHTLLIIIDDGVVRGNVVVGGGGGGVMRHTVYKRERGRNILVVI